MDHGMAVWTDGAQIVDRVHVAVHVAFGKWPREVDLNALIRDITVSTVEVEATDRTCRAKVLDAGTLRGAQSRVKRSDVPRRQDHQDE